MSKKIKILFAFIALSVCLCVMSTTYSRYVGNTTGNIDVLFAKWQILVNNTNITNSESSTVTFTPVMEENENVADNVIAPSSVGYFDINIDPSNVDLSFKYIIDLSIQNENMPDIMITKYAIIPNDYIEGDPITTIDILESNITNTLLFDKNTENFKFESFVIRIYFEWYEGENETMNDETDTAIGTLAASEEPISITMNANISFEQLISE